MLHLPDDGNSLAQYLSYRLCCVSEVAFFGSRLLFSPSTTQKPSFYTCPALQSLSLSYSRGLTNVRRCEGTQSLANSRPDRLRRVNPESCLTAERGFTTGDNRFLTGDCLTLSFNRSKRFSMLAI